MLIESASVDKCPLCIDPKTRDKDQKIYTVSSPAGGYSGNICHEHLHVLVSQKVGEIVVQP